jgi:hypothetical protein
MLNNTKSTSDFYSELRTLLQTGDVQQRGGQKVGGASTGVGKGGTGEGTRRQSATEATVLMRKQQVDIAQTRALKSLRELAKRNEEAERRAKATVHAMSAKYFKTLGQNPDVRDGDPLYFFGYGLECMEDILFAGFCQVNTSVNLYLEEIDTRFNNLLVMSEVIEKALERARQLREETKEEVKQMEARQSEWLNEVKGQMELQWLKLLETQENSENEQVKEVKRSNRSLKMMVLAFAFLVVLIEVVPRVLGIR